MTRARAAIFREIGGGLSIEEIEVDDPAPDEVRMRTVACGVCHSDLHFMQGSIAGPRADRARPRAGRHRRGGRLRTSAR